ncbi:MAG: efflux RND transporter periplasmic adaptor subunit [Patescibacteria group bacterium]|nr:efflux RND transporter periplasmic adaptor subunit [Patescibacteria group bacterium]
MKKTILILFTLISLVLIGFLIFKPKKISYELVIVKRGEIEQVVSATGTVRPSQKIDLQFETNGRVKNILVKVGDQVKLGQTLIKLDDLDLQIQLLQQKAALEAAKARLDLLKTGASQEEIQLAETEVRSAEKSVENAEKNLIDVKIKAENDLTNIYNTIENLLQDAYTKAEDALNRQIDDLFSNDLTTNPQLTFLTTNQQAEFDSEWQRAIAGYHLQEFKNEINRLSFTESELDEALLKAQNHLIVIRDLFNPLTEAVNSAVGLSATTLSNYKGYLNTARANINTAIANLLAKQQAINSQKIINQININNAQASLDSARASLAKARDQLAIKKSGPKPEDIRYQEAQIRQQEASLAIIQDKIRKTILVAPINGLITDLNVEVGETVLANQIPITINSLGNFEIELDISETDISKIKVGQPAKISLDALPDEFFTGRVVKIDPAETVIQGVVYYKATVAFDHQDERIKVGMTVNVEIVTAKKENILLVPEIAVRQKNGKKFVKVFKDKKIKEVEVQTGLVNNKGEVEIISGLEGGETIVTFLKK